MPKKPATVISFAVVRVYPQRVGMGVGFSVVVSATFDKVRAQIEKTIGKSLKNCESGEGMRTCELEVAEKRTVTLIAGETGKTKHTLFGCYYFYANQRALTLAARHRSHRAARRRAGRPSPSSPSDRSRTRS